MSIKHMDLALSTELPLAQKMLLTVLADRANEDGECWPGQASLAKRCSLSERAVRDNLSKLEKLGLVEVINRRVNGRQATSIYRLHIPIQAADCAASNSPHRRQIDANTGGRLCRLNKATIRKATIRTSTFCAEQFCSDAGTDPLGSHQGNVHRDHRSSDG